MQQPIAHLPHPRYVPHAIEPPWRRLRADAAIWPPLMLLTLLICANATTYALELAGLLDLDTLNADGWPIAELRRHFFARARLHDLVFFAHVTAGPLALLLAPLQLLPTPRAQPAYFAAVAIAGASALVAALDAWAGPVAQLGLAELAVVWLAVTMAAAQNPPGSERQRAWLLLSCLLTMAAISLRVQLLLGWAIGAPDLATYRLVAWTCWLPQVVWWLRRA
jgi:hypothetical protein